MLRDYVAWWQLYDPWVQKTSSLLIITNANDIKRCARLPNWHSSDFDKPSMGTKNHNFAPVWCHVRKYLDCRYFTGIGSRGWPIQYISSILYRIPPKSKQQTTGKNHAPGHFHNGTMHTLGLAIARVVSCPTALAGHARLSAKQIDMCVSPPESVRKTWMWQSKLLEKDQK